MSSSTAAIALPSRIKWYDAKRGFGFCVVSRSDLLSALQSLPNSEEMTAMVPTGNSEDVDLFIPQAEAEAARGVLNMVRGESIICSVGVDDQPSQQKKRLKACALRPPTPPDNGGEAEATATATTTATTATATAAAATTAAAAPTTAAATTTPAQPAEAASAEAQQRLTKLTLTVQAASCGTLDALSPLYTNHTLGVFVDVMVSAMNEAWHQCAAAGRNALEQFFQTTCFGAWQRLGTRLLSDPELVNRSTLIEKFADTLSELISAPYCWSQQQRRILQELQERCDMGLLTGSHNAKRRKVTEVEEGWSKGRLETALEQRTVHFVVVLEGVRNAANTQMIFRTCEAMGVQEVWLLPPKAGQKYRADLVRTRHASRGAEKLLTLRRFSTPQDVAEACRSENRELWVTHCPGPTSMAVPLVAGSIPTPLPKLALVMGTESDGASDEILALADKTVYLPMYGLTQSLNVAVAAGMFLQRLFDLHPDCRNDLESEAKAQLRTTWSQICGLDSNGTRADGEDDQEEEEQKQFDVFREDGA